MASFQHASPGLDVEQPDDEYSDWASTPRAMQSLDTEMDITPMIDITFLLLIFFLVASRMDANALVDLPEARHGTTVTVTNSAVLTVVPAGESVAVYAGESVDPAAEMAGDAATQNQLVEDYVKRELNADVPKQQVIIRAAKEVKQRDVARLLSAVSLVPGAKVYVAVIEASS